MIPINKPLIDDQEVREVLSVLEEGALTDASLKGGRRVQDLEALLCGFLKVRHVVAVNSGTAALHAALLAAGIGQGDEVLLPSFTFVATANAVVAAGAKPVFVDIKRDDYTMDVADLERRITARSRAVIPVHLYGHPCGMDELLEAAGKHSLSVIEDACQSLGSTYKGKQTGTFGIMGCYSMYASKVITAGEGGAIATNDDGLADKLRMIRNHGMVEGYDTRIFGLNMRLPELCAAIAKVQMGKLAGLLDIRRGNANMMSDLLRDCGKVRIPQEGRDSKFNWYLYTVAIENAARDRVKSTMQANGIGTAVYYDPPVHQTPYYRMMAPETKLPETEWSAKHVLSLPVHPGVDEEGIHRIASTLHAALKSP